MTNPNPLVPPIADIGEALDLREQVARAIYDANPCGDQETDSDGRPAGPGYVIPFETLAEYDAGLHSLVFEQADAALAIVTRTPSASEAKLVEALQSLSDASDQINGEIDRQTYDAICRKDWVIPPDAEFGIVLSYRDMDRFDRAICKAQQLVRGRQTIADPEVGP